MHRALCAAMLSLALVASGRAHAEDPPSPAFESPPVLHAQDLAPASLLQGAGFQVEDAVPTDGIVARFTIRSDVGVFEAYGVETLAVRIAELNALRALDRAAQTPTFAKAVAEAAARRYDAPSLPPSPNVAVGADPALDRFFGASDRASVADHAKTERGHEQERRSLARRLGIDPYTMQPALASKLADMAWVSYVGGALRDALLPPAALERQALPGSGTARALVYDTPREELNQKNVERMRAFGATEEGARAVEWAHALSLSVQTALVEALGRLPQAQHRADVLALAATLETGDQALFLVRAVGILADRNEQAPVVDLIVKDLVVAKQESGQLVAVVPADTLAWTAALAAFAQREELAAPERAFWISGRATARARDELEKLGWAVHEGVKP
jgi:hypothetical protein